MDVVDQAADSVHLLIVSSQTFSLDERHNVLYHINSSLNQIGEPVLAKKEELVRILKSQPIDSNKIDEEYSTEYKNGVDFDFQLLVNGKSSSFRLALQEFFKSTFKRKYLILTTSDYNLHGDIHLQDGVFTYDDLVMLANEEDVKRVTKENKTSKSFAFISSKLADSHKNWKNLEKSLNIELIAVKPQLVKSDENLNELTSCLIKYFNSNSLCNQLETSKTTGTLRIIKPSLYIFPARMGDSAFFTINGFSMLVNGGYERVRPCFWKFVNMLQQIDSVLITHTDSDALGGLSALFAKKLTNPDVKPHILTVLGNLIGTKNVPSDAANAELAANLIVNEVSQETNKSHHSDVDLILDAIDKLKIKLMPLVKNDISSRMASGSKYEHINLYYKLGQGSLDLYVLSPFASSADYKEFVSQQQNRFTKNVHQKSHIAVQNYFRQVPLSHTCSAVCLLVWLPAPNKAQPTESNALRLLFTGNAPQNVIFNALDKVKDFDVLTTPVYRQKCSSGDSEATTSKATNGVKKPPVGANGSASANSTNGASLTGKPVASAKQPTLPNGSHGEPTQSKSNSVRASTGGPSGVSSSLTSKSTNLAPSETSGKAGASNGNATAAVKPPKSTSNLHSLAGTNSSSNAAANKKKSTTDGKADGESTNDTKASASTAEKKALKSTSATVSSSNLKKDDKATANGGVSSTSTATSDKKTTDAKQNQSKQPANKQPTTASASTSKASTSTKQVQPGSGAASATSKDASKKTLSLTATKSSAANGSATEPKKDESKIITKRDKPKDVKPTTSTNATASVSSKAPTTPTRTSAASMASIAISSPPPPIQETVQQVPVVETNDQIETVIEAVEATEEINEPTDEIFAQGEVVNEVSPTVEETNPTPPPVEVAAVHIEESLGKSIDILNQQQLEEEVARSVGASHGGVNHELVFANESPNLSPVKKDASSNSTLDHNHHNHNGTNHHEHVDSMNEVNCVNGTNGENGVILSNGGGYDIMTTSFIEDSSNPDSNPFNGGTTQQPGRKIDLNESENDLNKTHQLSDDGGDEIEEGELIESINSFKQQQQQNPVIDTDALTSVLQSLNIEQHNNNQIHMMNCANSSNSNDPNSWGLLQLPKPVNPNDVAAPTPTTVPSNGSSTTPTTAASNSSDKKPNTPNGKKSISTANPPQSPLSDVSNKPTTAVVNRNQSANNSKPSVSKLAPVNPVYLEMSYVPAHGNGHYCDADFFKRVRARHFVFSSEELSENTLNALIEGKDGWSGEDKNLPVTIVPTYESEVLRTWFLANQEKLDRLKIDVLPAANMATVTLDENPNMSCRALKIEF